MKGDALRLLLVLFLSGLSTAALADLRGIGSPGPLAAAHASLEASCDKCHVPFRGVPDSACLDCHRSTGARIASGVGSHASFARAGQRCTLCHSDHEGRKRPLSPPPAKGFDHRVSGFPLDGKHARVACMACHPSTLTPSGEKGTKWVDVPKACIACHRDAHEGKLGASCGACHGAAAWKPTSRTVGDHKLDMTGGHAGKRCADCHAGGEHLTPSSSCADCHRQTHGGTKAPCTACHGVSDWKSATFKHDFCTCKLPGKHLSSPCLSCHPAFRFVPTPMACAGCHQKDLTHEPLGACGRCHSALSWSENIFDHNRRKVGFALAGKHLRIDCSDCHKTKKVFTDAPRACVGCHPVPKHGDFGDCAACHDAEAWVKTSFSHDRTRFVLDGKHATVACETCHSRFTKGQFEPGASGCALCHADPHKGQFSKDPHAANAGHSKALASDFSPFLRLASIDDQLPPLANHQVSPNRACSECHDTRGWKPSTIDPVKHASFGYALGGAHATVPCARCHEKGAYVGTPESCQSCHVGPHRGRLSQDCKQCHDESGWKQAQPFDHFARTRFALDGPHRLACNRCHGDQHERLVTTKTVGCATCHTPKHGETFGARCEGCHRVTSWNEVPPFDHNRTMFPLERKHLAVACLDCHSAGRGRTLDPSCRACHGDPHRGRARLDCADCHRPDRWTLIRFDHDRTAFPLNGRHFFAPCAECHVNQYSGARAECVSCHRGDWQRADAKLVAHRTVSFSCADCHTVFRW